MTAYFMFASNESRVESQTRERTSVPTEYTWNLTDIYPSDEVWKAAREKLASRFDHVLKFKGKLAESASILLDCLEFNSRMAIQFLRLYSYAMMKSDEDTRNSLYLSMRQEMGQMGTEYRARASFIEPEIARMDKETIDRFIEQEPGLKIYKMYLTDIQRRKAHKLSEKEEKILANAGMVTEGPHDIFSVFSNAELPYPEVVLSDGKRVKLDQAGYARFRALPERENRKIVFKTYWEAIDAFRGTLGVQLYNNIKKDIFYARSRNYSSALTAALDGDNIPEDVYHTLIRNVHAHLDTFHRYLELRKRMLGVDALKYYDLYAPVVKEVDLNYDFDQAKHIIVESAEPMGREYIQAVQRAFDERWIDVYPTHGKRSGAYSNDGGYEVHPYILMNYNGKYKDVSTLAHEMGHAMHTYLSNKHQPFPTADYSIFTAEVASTFNEVLLVHHLLRKIEDDGLRLSLLMDYLDEIRGTVFRQTLFAEYELLIHERVEKGESLTGDNLTEMYAEILMKYYGHEKGVCHIDKYVTVEWAMIPHFYYNFYIYQYATSFTASTALSEGVLNGEEGVLEKYLALLSAGGSEYPIDLLKTAGVDMTTPEPFQRTMEVMNRTMDEIEKILNKKN